MKKRKNSYIMVNSLLLHFAISFKMEFAFNEK